VVCGHLPWVTTQFLARLDSPVSSPTPPQPNLSVKPTFQSVKDVSHHKVQPSQPWPQLVMDQVPTLALSVTTELVSNPVSLVKLAPSVPNVVSNPLASLESALH